MSRRAEIVRRATEVFERQGVAHTSIEDIAKAVGIKREGIYYYFKSREEIVLEIILPQSQSLRLNLRNILRAEMPALEKLHAAIGSHLESFNPGYLEMSVALREEHFSLGSAKLRELRAVWKEYSDGWIALIRDGQERGEFSARFNPKVIAYGILGMCNWLSRWYVRDKAISIPEIVDNYFMLAANGLAQRDDVALPQAMTPRSGRLP